MSLDIVLGQGNLGSHLLEFVNEFLVGAVEFVVWSLEILVLVFEFVELSLEVLRVFLLGSSAL
jgi:hypothetical protein